MAFSSSEDRLSLHLVAEGTAAYFHFRSSDTLTPQTSQQIRQFVFQLQRLTGVTLRTCCLALLFISRVKPSGVNHDRFPRQNMFLAALLLAHKVLKNGGCSRENRGQEVNLRWAELTKLAEADINKSEMIFLGLCKNQIHVGEQELAGWVTDFCAIMCDINREKVQDQPPQVTDINQDSQDQRSVIISDLSQFAIGSEDTKLEREAPCERDGSLDRRKRRRLTTGF